MLLPTVLFGLVAWQTYERTVADAFVRLDRAARIAQEHASRVIETNIVISGQIERILDGLSDADIAALERELHAELKRLTEDLPQLSSVFVWNADGQPILSNRFLPASQLASIADRDYVRAARDQPDWVIGRPVLSRATGETFVPVARRRQSADGRFAGGILVSLRPSHFSEFYATLASAEPGLAVGLIGLDGAVLARWPELPGGAGATLPASSPPMRALAAGRREATFAGTSPIDGAVRYGAYRQMRRYPILVSTGIDRNAALAGWVRSTLLLALFTFPMAVGLAWLSRGALRRARREREALAHLRRETERRDRAEQALLQSQKLEAIGQLTGGVAHDFNNLLMVVSNNAHLLMRMHFKATPSPQVAAIERAVAAGSNLTRQLLAFSRRQALRPETVRLQDRVPGLLELIRASTGRGVEVESHVAADVPAVRVDPAELELALINLAINARDAMPQGGRLSIVARCVDPAPDDGEPCPRVAISVSDTGTGIAAEHRARVFEPFFTTKPAGQGSGLGLSQVYGFAAQAGGSVSLESEPGAGTTVSILLPAAAEPPDASAPAAPAEAPVDLAGRVLLVEDNPEVAAATVPVLESFGCRVEHAADASAALAAIDADPKRFDAVLSDVVMPGPKNGIDLALELRDRHPALPVALLTGYAAELHRAIEAGFEVIAKPCAPRALAATLARLLAQGRGTSGSRQRG